MTHMFPPGPFQRLPTCSPMLQPCPCLRTLSLIHFPSCNQGGLDKGSLFKHLQGLLLSQDNVHLICYGAPWSPWCPGILDLSATLASPLVTPSFLWLHWHSSHCPIPVQQHPLLHPVICTCYFLSSEDFPALLSNLVQYNCHSSFKTCLNDHIPENTHPN